jgi:hypothetical protein
MGGRWVTVDGVVFELQGRAGGRADEELTDRSRLYKERMLLD